jgi:GxxExxY protein
MLENKITKLVIGHCIEIHKEFGPGLLESIYETILFRRLSNEGLIVHRQVVIPLIDGGEELGSAFKADLIVENNVIVELKSVEALAPIHMMQVLSYLKISGLRLGLLINFNTTVLTKGIKRIVNNF